MSENVNEKECAAMSDCACGVKKPTNLFDRINVNFFSITCFVSSLFLTLMICAATFVRYVLKGDLYGYEEWVKLLAFWLYFMGASIGAFNRTHVSADIVNSYMPEGFLKRLMFFVKDLITVGVSLLFVWYGYEFFMFGFMGPLGTRIAIPKTTIWRISLWTSYLAVFSGLIFMAYYFTRDLVLSTVALFKGGNK